MARLLSPADFGLYAVALVFVGVAQLLRDFGVTSFLIQAKEIDREMQRAAFGLMLLLAWVIALTLIGASSAIAGFYQEPALRNIILVLSLNFFVTPLGSVTLSIARRDMRFRELAFIGIATTVISIAVTIYLAFRGHGAMSIAWGAVANTFSTFLLSLTLRKPDMTWMPSLRGAGMFFKFGGTVTLSSILSFLNSSATDVLLGRLMSMQAVGLFNRASSLNRYFATALGSVLGPVLLPWLSQLNRDGKSLKEVYGKITELVTGLAWPVYALIAVLADPLVHVLFGKQWSTSAELVPYICLAAMISSIQTASGPLFIARGRPSYNLVMESINLPLKVAAVMLAAPHGLLAVALTWPILALVRSVIQQTMLKREFDIRLMDARNYLGKSLLLTLVPTLLTWAIMLPMEADMPNGVKLLVAGSVGFLAWLVTMKLVCHPLHAEIQKIIARARP